MEVRDASGCTIKVTSMRYEGDLSKFDPESLRLAGEWLDNGHDPADEELSPKNLWPCAKALQGFGS
jgi:hypothetical protein